MTDIQTLLAKLTPASITALTPYQSARRIDSGGDAWLNANENYCSPGLDGSDYNRYPACQPEGVVTAYAKYAGRDASDVLVTRGADEGIELLIRALCEPGKDSILICPPTYGMYAISAETHNVAVQKVMLNDDFILDMDGILKAVNGDSAPKLVFVCRPNNPTGTTVTTDNLEQVIEGCRDKALVVLDEAYIEFCAQGPYEVKANMQHVVVLRTLSKAFGLAGLRCGFTLAAPEIIELMLKVIAPYPISQPVADIASLALSEVGINAMRQSVDEANTLKATLEKSLVANGFNLIANSDANFVMIRGDKALELFAIARENGILLRDQSRQPNLGPAVRISMGSPEQMTRLIALIDENFGE